MELYGQLWPAPGAALLSTAANNSIAFFSCQAEAPNLSLIPQADLLDVTVLLLTCSYREREFVRIGYYVRVDYQDPQLQENPPETPIADKLFRHVLSDKPKVTRYAIPWLVCTFISTVPVFRC